MRLEAVVVTAWLLKGSTAVECGGDGGGCVGSADKAVIFMTDSNYLQNSFSAVLTFWRRIFFSNFSTPCI